MNCFFASCHISENPELKGIPLVVAHNDEARKSIILTASYEARKYGVKSGMPTYQAMLKCKNAIMLPGDFELYKNII